jgi:hypothetical protein
MANVEYGKINLFYSYAHEDEAFCEEIMRSLELLRSEGVVSEWYDRRISPGENWRNAINDNLARAKIVLLMISPDFLTSDYCMGVELQQALERHWQRQCRIVPIIIRDCRWTNTPFGSFQALPKDGKPLSNWSSRAGALSSVAEGIRKVCSDIVDWENPYRRSAIGDWTETEQTMLDKQSGQRDTITLELRVLGKSTKKKRATVGFTAKRNGQIIPLSEFQQTGYVNGVYEMGTDRINIPLDEPLEDNLGSFMRQLRVQLPRNAEVEKKETGYGEQKISIGGRQYYCTWMGYEICIAVGLDRLVCAGKTWRCIDVPLDGIVRVESENPYSQQKTILLAYGFGGR